MGVHRATEFRRCRFQGAGQSSLGDQISRAMPNNVTAEDLTILFVDHKLDKPFLMTRGNGFPESTKWELASFHFIAMRLGLFLAQTDDGDFRLTINTRGNP